MNNLKNHMLPNGEMGNVIRGQHGVQNAPTQSVMLQNQASGAATIAEADPTPETLALLRTLGQRVAALVADDPELSAYVREANRSVQIVLQRLTPTGRIR